MTSPGSAPRCARPEIVRGRNRSLRVVGGDAMGLIGPLADGARVFVAVEVCVAGVVNRRWMGARLV